MNKLKEIRNKYFKNEIIYRFEMREGLAEELKEKNVLMVFGASDDLMEFEGAICDEFYDIVKFDNKNNLIENDCFDDECPYFLEKLEESKFFIKPIFCKEVTFDLETNVSNFEKIDVVEDEELYGYAYLFDLDNISVKED